MLFWLQAGVAPGWGGDIGRVIDEVTAADGPVAPFVRPGRSKVGVMWSRVGEGFAKVSDVSSRARAKRVVADPKNAGHPEIGVVSFVVWGEGHPFWDARPDHVAVSLQFGSIVPQLYVEVTAPDDESAAMVASAEAWVRGWGARFGGAGIPRQDPENDAVWHRYAYVSPDPLMKGVLEMGLVDPVVVGPSWLMVFRPGTFSDDVVPAGLEWSPQVSKVNGPDGEYTVVTLAEDARSVDQAETDRWLSTLGPLMDPVLQDPMAALELRRAFTARRRAALAEQDGGPRS